MNTQGNQLHDNPSRSMDDTGALLDATAQATEETVVEARNRLLRALDAVGETGAKLKAKAVESAKAADKKIRENPYQAVGVALGVGALLGALLGIMWSRRNRD